MIHNIDHVTIAVKNLEEAKRFFNLFNFKEVIAVEIEGQEMSNFMGIPDLKASHVTLSLENSNPSFEIQLLKFHNPTNEHPTPPGLNKTGFNHICFKVDNITQEIKRLKANNVVFLNDIMDFHNKKLIFIKGPDNTVIELAEYK